MKQESFNSSAESKDTDDKAESKSSASESKATSRGRRIGSFVAKNVREAPNIHRAEPERQSFWQELIKPPAEKKDEKAEKDKPLDVLVPAVKPELEAAKPPERREEEPGDPEAQIDKWDKQEKLEIVRRITDARETEAIEQVADAKSAERAEGKEESAAETETVEVEAAASSALMKTFREKVAENPDADPAEILDESTAEVVEKIRAGSEAEAAGQENQPADQTGQPIEGELPLHGSAPEEDDTVVIPLAGSSNASGGNSSGGGSSNGPGSGTPGGPGPGGPGPNANMPPPVPGGPGGPGGPNNPNIPPPAPPPPPGGPPYGPPFGPYGPGPGPGPGPTGPNFNTLQPVQPGVSPEDLQIIVRRQERTVLAQGLLIGGIIGYLIGRRRGRIKTEKRLLPIQEKLEKKVEGLQSAVIAKEQIVRRMAAERAREIATQEEREKFMSRLARADDIRAKAETARRQREAERTERSSQMLVEAPTVVMAGAAAAKRVERGVTAARREVDFKKKVEDYTEPELKQAAEKIRIDGTSLKELWDGGRLNERAVKRVMQEFIEGRSVRAALTHELLERDLRFEKDPKIRDAIARQLNGADGGSGGAAVKAAALTAGAGILLRNLEDKSETGSPKAPVSQWQAPEKSAETSSPQSSYRRKTAELLDKAKEDPKIQIAAVASVMFILIAAALIFA